MVPRRAGGEISWLGGRRLSSQAEMADMGEPEGRKGVDGGSQRPAASPGLRRRRAARRVTQMEKRTSVTPKPVSIGERVTVLEGRTVGEIARLNLCYTQSAAMFEYDGAMVQDLSTQLFRALARIDVLEAAVMVRPRSDDVSAGMGTSNDTMVDAGRPENFGDCDEFRDGRVVMASNAMVQPPPTMPGLLRDEHPDV